MRELTEREKMAHEAARDTVKHLVTLTTAALGLIIVIHKDLLGANPPVTLWWAIAVFSASALAGLLALQSLTGNLEKRESPSVYTPNVVPLVAAQVLGFFVGIALSSISVGS